MFYQVTVDIKKKVYSPLLKWQVFVMEKKRETKPINRLRTFSTLTVKSKTITNFFSEK